MEQLNTDLATLQTALTAVDAAVEAVAADVAALPTSEGGTDPNDAVVENIATILVDAGIVQANAVATEPELPEGNTTSIPVTDGSE